MKNIILVGQCASGKSTVGKLLSRMIGYHFLDLDSAIACTFEITPAEIFERYGEGVFRELECAVLSRSLTEDRPQVISTGYGTILRSSNRYLLSKRGHVVNLEVEFAEAQARLINAEKQKENNVASTHFLRSNLARQWTPMIDRYRRPYYKAVSNISIDTSRLSPKEVANRVVLCLNLKTL